MKIVILDGFLANFDDIGLAIGDHQQVWYPETEPADVIARIGDADGVIVNRVNISEETMKACPNLKFIGTFSTGYNMIDVPAASARGITVCNVPGYSTMSVAQHAFSLLLEIVGRVGQFNQFVKSGTWNEEGYANIAQMPTYELAGKTLGIFGAGNIGTQMARLGQAFGMNVIAYRRTPPADATIPYVDFETLLAQSDVLSLHAPLTAETQGLFCKENLDKMKDGAILINTARGLLLNDADVVAALDSGKLMAVGTDVLSQEPPAQDNLIYRHPKVTVTPHVGWISRETRERLLDYVAGNILAYLAGEPTNVVN